MKTMDNVQNNADPGIILLDDSRDSVQIIENELEEGEVIEPATIKISDFIDTAAKIEEPITPTTEPNAESESMVFEVKFPNNDDFEMLHERLLAVLEVTFPDKLFVYRLVAPKDNGMVPSIGAYRSIPVKAPASPSPEKEIYLIDTTPAAKLNAAQVPSYKRCSSIVLDENTELRKKLKADEVNKCFRPKVKSSCFNCGETDHSLRDCTRPRNNNRIQRARKLNTNRVERYHVDNMQRFAHIRPGKISTKTRHAMGYSRGELPFMFYRLRVLGYPPAWLEDAKVKSSGLALFNGDGEEVQESNDEEGEADTFKYDITKIIEFPGYNVHPGADFYDDYKHHNVPRFQEHQLKENFIRSLGENVTKGGYKRRKLKDFPVSHTATTAELDSQSTANLIVHDMEIDDASDDSSFIAPPGVDDNISPTSPPLPAKPPSSIRPPPTPTSPPQSLPTPSSITPPRATVGDEKIVSSPNLEDLEAKQAELLEQLDANTSDLKINVSKSCSVTDFGTPQPDKRKSPLMTLSAPSTPVAIITTPFKSSIEGTPILKFSKYDKLPISNNFKVGVSDVINFENLPDSTGKYDQMKGILKNVRKTMVRLQNDD